VNDPSSNLRVPIRGAGVIAASALGIDAFRHSLESGATMCRPISRFDVSGLRARRAALVENFTARDFIPPLKLRRMNALSRLAVAAMKLALVDAGIERIEGDRSRIGVAVGTTFGPVQTSVDYLREYVEKGAALAPPQLFAESVANAPGSHIAIEHDLQGFNVTFTQRESSAMAALMFAATQLAKGTVDTAVVAGAEEMNDITFSVLDKIGTLAHCEAGLEEACRPFDRRRNGMSVGEGGAVLLLGRLASDREPLAWISGFGMSRDATASVSDWGHDHLAVARAMSRAIDDAALEPSSIDAIWASANGTRRADRLEYRAIQSLFGDHPPPVVATKGCFGEYAAAGALQIASAALALRHQTLYATPGFEEGEDEMSMEVTRSMQPAALRHVLVNSISAGGGVISAVLSRGESA
jgi:3-oxoacyl-[acyl-carrier-protein] synthase II